ncbi:MAG: hypothetical protein H7246_09395 [Phycisphaerae bacterium]|nr:hypothetical protein [Saprospiraceae bacterium]
MKIFTLSFASLLVASTLFSQKASVEIGPEFKTNGDMYLWNHLYSDPSGHYVLLAEENRGFFLYKKFTPILQKYDRAFNLGLNKEIKIEDSDIEFDDMLYAQQKFVLCTRNNDKNASKVTISATIVGMDATSQKTQRIASIPYDNRDNLPNMIKWKISADTSKILLAAWADHDDDKIQTKLLVSVQDNQLANIWKHNFTLPYTQEQLKILNLAISNTGQVFLSAKVYYDKKDKKASNKKDDPAPLPYKMVIFSMDATNDKAREISPEVTGKFITDLSINVGKNGDLYYAGLYTNDNKGVIQGIFYNKTNGQTGAVEVAINKELSESDIKNFNIKKDKSGNEGLDPNFEMKDLILREDGGVVLTAEEVFTTHESYTSTAGRMETVTNYNTNDVLVSSISPKGSVDWVKMVPKKQAFGGTEKYSSYALMVSGASLCFVYNDDKDNISQPVTALAKDISSFRDAVAGMLTISGDGKMERQKVFDIKKDSGTLLVPESSKQISANELFFVTTGTFKLTGKNMYRLGVIRIN